MSARCESGACSSSVFLLQPRSRAFLFYLYLFFSSAGARGSSAGISSTIRGYSRRRYRWRPCAFEPAPSTGVVVEFEKMFKTVIYQFLVGWVFMPLKTRRNSPASLEISRMILRCELNAFSSKSFMAFARRPGGIGPASIDIFMMSLTRFQSRSGFSLIFRSAHPRTVFGSLWAVSGFRFS